MLKFSKSGTSQSLFVSWVSRRLFTGTAAKSRARQWLDCSEALEVRCLLSTLSANLDNGLLTVSDVDATGKNNLLTVTVDGTVLTVSDANEQFIAAPAGGTLSDGGRTLTMPLSLVTSGLTLNAGGGDDVIDINSIDAAFNSNLIVNGDAGADTVTFQGSATSVGSGNITVSAETINVNSGLTAGGAVNLTSTGDDTTLSINAAVTAGANSEFSADKMFIIGPVNLGTHILTVAPESTADANDSIDIGSTTDSASNMLQLSNAELDHITAATIIIGDTKTSTITVSAAIQQSGDSNIQVVTGRNIVFQDGAGWATNNGSLSFTANQAATGTGNFFGIEVNDATLMSTGSGNIALVGRGGNTGVENHGVFILGGSVISSTGAGGIVLTGVGGSADSSNRGVELNDATTTVTSASGDIRITGQGGAGTGNYNFGVWMVLGPTVSSTGNARIFIEGTGGTGISENNGVLFNGYGYSGATHLTTQDGDITITGNGSTSATGAANRGIGMYAGAFIQSKGNARITLNGTGGTGTDSARGVELDDTGTLLTSVSGDIHITGQGGANTSGYGLWMLNGAAIESTGTAKITIDGTAGDNANDGAGVSVDGNGNGTHISSVDGDISINGHGGNFISGTPNRGIVIQVGAAIQSTGAARIILNGTGGNSSDSSRGVEIGDGGTRITSQQGDISITGHGGAGSLATTTYNIGVWIRDNAVVESTATSGLAAKVTINGTGGSGAGSDVGTWITSSGQVASTLGDIQITGQGGSGTGRYHHGVNLQGGGTIVSSGTAKITVDGTGGSGVGEAIGVYVVETNSGIQSVNGDIQITGHGGSGGNANIGVGVQTGGFIKSTGTARVMMNGTGGTGTDSNYGVRIYGSDSFVHSDAGDIQITGQGGAGSTDMNSGVRLAVGASVTAKGSARITLNGTGGGGVNENNGVVFNAYGEDGPSHVTAQDGDITITGVGSSTATGSGNRGIGLYNGVTIQSTGNARIILNG
ncbi:MAG: hypothetical protein JWM11_5513, partial [Planctomycetaceae bacterium]|nr:hypothetical protein [Planctomycetaceae bacterium]